jgi:hypothetical protein
VSNVSLKVFSLEMKGGGVESPKAEIAVDSVNCALSFTSAIVTDPGFVCAETITSGADVFFKQPTLVFLARVMTDRQEERVINFFPIVASPAPFPVISSSGFDATLPATRFVDMCRAFFP